MASDGRPSSDELLSVAVDQVAPFSVASRTPPALPSVPSPLSSQ